MRCKAPVRFLGEGVLVTAPPYPTSATMQQCNEVGYDGGTGGASRLTRALLACVAGDSIAVIALGIRELLCVN